MQDCFKDKMVLFMIICKKKTKNTIGKSIAISLPRGIVITIILLLVMSHVMSLEGRARDVLKRWPGDLHYFPSIFLLSNNQKFFWGSVSS